MFAKMRKHKSEAGSVLSGQDYNENIRAVQPDNLSQYSHESRGSRISRGSRGSQGKVQPKPQPQPAAATKPLNVYDPYQSTYQTGYGKPEDKFHGNPRGRFGDDNAANNNRKYMNNLNNLAPSEGKGSDAPSVSSSSSAADQYICNNCINEALIYEKQLNSKNTEKLPEDPMNFQDKLNAMERDQRNNRINEIMNRAEQAAKYINNPTNKDKLIDSNEKGTFFLNKDNQDPQIKKVMDKYNENDLRNRNRGGGLGNKPGVDDYYRNYVDNYKNNEEDPYGDEDRKNQQEAYNKALKDQIEQNQKLRSRGNDKRFNDERQKEDEKYAKLLEEEERKKKERENELFKANRDLIEAKRKKAENDKMLDEYDQRKNAADMKKKMDDEDERLRRQEDAKRKGWQKALDNQINEKNQRNKLENDLNRLPNDNKFGNEECTCQNGKCCVCKRTYPLNVLNPRKKYASLARIQKMRKKREQTNRNNALKEKEKVNA